MKYNFEIEPKKKRKIAKRKIAKRTLNLNSISVEYPVLVHSMVTFPPSSTVIVPMRMPLQCAYGIVMKYSSPRGSSDNVAVPSCGKCHSTFIYFVTDIMNVHLGLLIEVKAGA
jgi:hypothetical protein